MYSILVLVCISGFIFLHLYKKPTPVVVTIVGYKDATYIIEGKIVKLTNGTSETSGMTGSSPKVITRYFGNEAQGDLNGDGMNDTAFLLTQQSGSGEIFYYVVVALGGKNSFTGTNALLLGNRIAPQSSEINGNELVVQYADRKPEEVGIETPSVSLSKYFVIKDNQLTKEIKPVTYTARNAPLSVTLDPDTIAGYTVDTSYVYSSLGPEKESKGVQFMIPESLTLSTNLSKDSYVSVEAVAATTSCMADIFLPNQITPSKTIVENGVQYSMANGGGAAAGNRYDETVYALQDSSEPCVAIRYFIHWSVVENYPEGTISEFDKKALFGRFDSIRKALVIHK